MTEQEKRDLAADIGDEALDFDDDSSRKIFIEEKCGNDASLAQYVREYIDGFKQVLGARDGSLPNQASYSAGRAQSAPLVGADGIIDHRYKLVRQLGLGGMGTVFRAIELATGKAAAIKFIQGAHAGSESARMRFVREARAVASLCHPNIVRVYDIGQIKGALYIVMEYVRGSRLEVVAAQAHISLQTKLSIMAQVCNALAYAHAQGVIHRDVKPGNVLVLRDHSVKVIDFGISEQAGLPNLLVSVGGTPLFMSPEQIAGQKIDARSDIWSAGVTLFYLLTNRLPYQSSQAIMTSSPPMLPQGVPLASAIEPILARALANDREARYATAKEFGNDLRQLLQMYEIRAVSVPETQPDVSPSQTRTAEPFTDGTYALPDLKFKTPFNGELTVNERMLGEPEQMLGALGSLSESLPNVFVFRVFVFGTLVILLSLLQARGLDSAEVLIAFSVVGISSATYFLFRWKHALDAEARDGERPKKVELPRCKGCGKRMQLTAQWMQLVNRKEEAIFGYRDCMAALKHGLWEDAAKLLSIHGRKYSLERAGTHLLAPARYQLQFFECEGCGDHSAVLTRDEMVNGNWEQQPKFGEAYWGIKPGRLAPTPEDMSSEAPKPNRQNPSSMAAPPTNSIERATVDPAKLSAVNEIAKQILDSGRVPEYVFVCKVANGLLVFKQANDQKPIMLLFSNPFAASDYLRATGTSGTVGQFKVEALRELAQSWISSGLQAAILDRCPRCTHFVSIGLAVMATWTSKDFANVWAQLRAVRLVQSRIRIGSAMKHSEAGSLAAARADLEYVRDHFDCGVPYLRQMIGILAGMQQDEAAIAAAIERLKEFGPQFEASLKLTPESGQLLATATVGMMASFGMLPSGTELKREV